MSLLPSTSRSLLHRVVRPQLATRPCRRLLSEESAAAKSTTRPVRRVVTQEERTKLRAQRKKESLAQLRQQQSQGASGGAAASGPSLQFSRWMWYAGVAVPTVVLAWGISDPDSPPAKLSDMIGLTGLIKSFTDEIAKPSHEKLLPDWSQMPNVPQDIPVPHTLVLDLENTLVSSTWDRKYGWRHAKRPGVDKFLHELAQYYEIVLYSPSIDGIADPVVTSLDKDGCIMHRLYRDATHYHNGVHVKDLAKLNRSLKRMIVIDDDPAEVQFHPENLIRVKPYTDPLNRTDNTLERITPFLIEVAREGYSDIPTLLSQYQGMDADEIADEQDRRVRDLRQHRQDRSRAGLGRFGQAKTWSSMLPTPELAPDVNSYYPTTSSSSAQQLTAKDIAGAAPPDPSANEGFVGWMNRRAQSKQEHQQLKMEKWNEFLMKKQQEKKAAEEEAEKQRNKNKEQPVQAS